MGQLYRLDFASGKAYIGMTRGTAELRFAGHRYVAMRSAKGIVYRAWRKYGEPVLTVIGDFEDLAALLAAERTAIATFRTLAPHGYNMTEGGDGAPSKTPAVAAKISAALKGRTISEEQRRNIGKSRIGCKHTDEARQRMSIAQTGRVMTEEHRAKLAAAKRGTTRPAEVRAKMSASQRARRAAEGCSQRSANANNG